MSFFTNNKGENAIGDIPQQTDSFEYTKTYLISDDKVIDTSEIDSNTSGPQDYSGYYGNKNVGKIFFRSVITGYEVIFPAIIDTYNESFKPTFSSEQVYGRSDAYQKYNNTGRSISLGFTIPSYDEEHARKNLHALCALVQFLYPSYDGSTIGSMCNPLVISKTPLLRVRFANLIQRSGRGNIINSQYLYSYDGILCVPTNFTFTPNLEMGFFPSPNGMYLYPKETKVSMGFDILHEETPGWIEANGNTKHWIGKLGSDGNRVKKNVDFPWGNDNMGGEVDRAASALNAAKQVNGTPIGEEE